jgi:hypothetical protein
MSAKPKFKHGQRVLVRAIIGPSGMSGDHGVFVRVNTDDPEIWVHVSDIVLPHQPAPPEESEHTLTLKEILDVLYKGRTMTNFNHVPSVTRAIDWLSQDFRAALAHSSSQTASFNKPQDGQHE